VEFQIICLNETWFNDVSFFHKLFPNSLTTVRSNSVNSTKSSAAFVTAFPYAFNNFKDRIYRFMTNVVGLNFEPKLPQFTEWCSVPLPTIPTRKLFRNIFLYPRRTWIPYIIVFFYRLFLCCLISLVERFALSNCYFYLKLKSIQFTPQLSP